MEINELNNLGLPKKIEKKHSDEVQSKKTETSQTASPERTGTGNDDTIQISDKAKELQRNDDEIKMARQLLSNLPSDRAHVIYNALAKLRAGLYSEEQIVTEAAERLFESGDIDDILRG